MRQVKCSQCQQINQVPDDLPQAHCVRCGHVFVFDARLEGAPAPTSTSDAIFAEPALDRLPTRAPGPVALPERYADFDEFRSLSPAVQRELLQLATRALPDMRRVHLEPIPAEAPKEIDGWRRPVGTLRLPGENRSLRTFAAWSLIGFGLVLFLGGSLTLLDILREREGRSKMLGVAPAVMGIVSIAGGVLFGFGRRPQPPLTMWIFEEGVCVFRHGFQAARWEDVHDFEVAARQGRPIYQLRLPDEMPIVIDVAHTPEVMPIMEYVETRLSSSQFLSRLHAMLKGENQRFGYVELDRQGFRGPRFAARWPEVRRVVSDARNLLIESTRTTDWVSVPLDCVSFPYLVQALSHVMIEEHGRLPAV